MERVKVRTGRIKDRVGQTFGSLTVLCEKGRKDQRVLWECLCLCGEKILVQSAALSTKNTTSCGCKGLKKGEAGFNNLFIKHREQAKRRNLEWNIPKDKFYKLTSADCYYCGCIPYQILEPIGKNKKEYGTYLYNGLDRFDSSIGYILTNVVPACGTCNKSKLDRSFEEFTLWISNLLKDEKLVGFIESDYFGDEKKYGSRKGEAGFNKVIGAYRSRAKIAKREWKLSKEQVIKITRSYCYYCGVAPQNVSRSKAPRTTEWSSYSYNGIDRVDNNKGYIVENVVTCCVYCNKAKLVRTEKEFISWYKKVSNHLDLNNG